MEQTPDFAVKLSQVLDKLEALKLENAQLKARVVSLERSQKSHTQLMSQVSKDLALLANSLPDSDELIPKL